MPGQLPQNVVFIFQPAEETGGECKSISKKAGAFDKYPIEAAIWYSCLPILLMKAIAVIRDEEITASATGYRFFLTGLSSHVADKEQGHSCGEALQH